MAKFEDQEALFLAVLQARGIETEKVLCVRQTVDCDETTYDVCYTNPWLHKGSEYTTVSLLDLLMHIANTGAQ